MVAVSMRNWRLAVLVGLLALSAGCFFLDGGRDRVRPPAIDAQAAGAMAIQMYDADKDGVLTGAELDACPGLKAAAKLIDPSHLGVSATQITARIKMWQKSKLGRMSLRCSVMRNGQPLAGADVRFVPEKFLGECMQEAVGRTDENGNAMLSVSTEGPATLPGVPPGFYRVEVTKAAVNIPAQYNTKTILGQEVALDARGIQEGIKFDLEF